VHKQYKHLNISQKNIVGICLRMSVWTVRPNMTSDTGLRTRALNNKNTQPPQTGYFCFIVLFLLHPLHQFQSLFYPIRLIRFGL
jgi:hypothetical protein